MKILVGTLYHGETQYNRCCEAIRNQTCQGVTHQVIKGKNSVQAHYELYNMFFNEPNPYDLLIKVDADMELIDENVLEKIVSPFHNDNLLDQFNVQVHDYFTNSIIFGIEAFRKSLIYKKRDDFFEDMSIRGQRRTLIDYGGMRPAAYHCYQPDSKQAYSFGVHRAIKNQDDTIELLLKHYRESGEEMLGVACVGALDIYSGRIRVNPKNWKDIKQSFIQKRIKETRTSNFSKFLKYNLKKRRTKFTIKKYLFLAINRLLGRPPEVRV